MTQTSHGRARIGMFSGSDLLSGGNVYMEMVRSALGERFCVQEVGVRPFLNVRPLRLQRLARIWWEQRKMEGDVWIRDSVAAAVIDERRSAANICVFHHHDPASYGLPWMAVAYHRAFLRKARRCECVVTVADYWRRFLRRQGVRNLRVIRNAFDVTKYERDGPTVRAFRRRYGLPDDRPLVHVGVCQERKGVTETVQALSGLDVQLVTSGPKEMDPGIPHFMLPFGDYVSLLHACDVVVAMSPFREGWHRTAHEAMLCRTPVVGSGLGGMNELLTGGGQVVCRRFSQLAEAVRYALAHREELGRSGRRFAEQFTRERFQAQWISLVEEVLRQKGLAG